MSCARASQEMPSAWLVVDASVVIKRHVTEVHSDAALRLIQDDASALHVPDLMWVEGDLGIPINAEADGQGQRVPRKRRRNADSTVAGEAPSGY